MRTAVAWEELAQIWSGDDHPVLSAHGLEIARQTYYQLVLLDGEVVGITQEYQR